MQTERSFEDYVRSLPPYNPEWTLDRLRINHRIGTFSLPDGESFHGAVVVILGLVHQRVMFSADRRGIPCKSPNADIGIPSPTFPWDLSNFEPNDYPEKFEGYRELPCGLCRFTHFDSALDGGKAPACSEQYTMPLFLYHENVWRLAIFSVQKSGISPTRKLMTAWQRAGRPCYVNYVQLSLNLVGKGENYFSLPEYAVRQGTVNSNLYPTLSAYFRAIRHSLTAPPVISPTGKIVHSEIKYKQPNEFEGLV